MTNLVDIAYELIQQVNKLVYRPKIIKEQENEEENILENYFDILNEKTTQLSTRINSTTTRTRRAISKTTNTRYNTSNT